MLYIQFIVFTAGTLLAFFWMVVILGHRRQRNFERILFFLCLALFFFYGASLLAFNAQAYYPEIPRKLARFAWAFAILGLTMIPALLLHLDVEYAGIRDLLVGRDQKRWSLAIAYLPLLYFIPHWYRVASTNSDFDFITPINSLGLLYIEWLLVSFAFSLAWQWRFASAASDPAQKAFHRSLFRDLAVAVVAVVMIRISRCCGNDDPRLAWSLLAAVIPIIPLGALIRNVRHSNFLQIGRQRNLIYAVFLTFVALLYLALVRRVSIWLAPSVPPESTAAILLFLPVVFFEPLQRALRASLRQIAVSEMDRTQRLIGPILEVARTGNLIKLKLFLEKWIREQLQLSDVQLLLFPLADQNDGASTANGKAHTNSETESGRSNEDHFTIQQVGRQIGELRVTAHGAMLSGETEAALEFLSEQLPGPIDLCRLIAEKLHLERELAERERLAALGQMAASISHNLKNPLGSIKTILQVQLENSELPDSLRPETKMVLAEINRLSSTLSQLLKFSRPTLLGEAAPPASSDAQTVLSEVLTVLNHEAEKRGVNIVVQPPPSSQSAPATFVVAASKEALHDIFSNLLLNALEASPSGGKIEIAMESTNGFYEVTITDEGPGIPADLQQKILQPFFTTKTQGTGLGLTIVTRRLAEISGTLTFQSPLRNGACTKCTIKLPQL
jgi:signal transduction histidine kinase